ncbi:RcnB family protein [Sphingobium sp. AP49]|uniref:RcnB family protein n=1 Tax=Sphingobium sp. AP49 TaxID=1144307 RepID=UPI00026EE719|nr:RcnB family protein [Sphingobium sp. AP49]WHO37589.1 RcnB family protein [Sphingobium sp. AP49]
MRTRTILALGAGLLMAAEAGIGLAQTPPAATTSAGVSSAHRWGARPDGRWYAGWNAPGGWAGYQRPVRGYALPSYWTNPAFQIANYRIYGLSVPPAGYSWSRYYDDAVMIDRYGRVYDTRNGIDWTRYEGGYDDAATPPGAAYAYADDSVTYNSNYQGRWTGTWQGQDGKSYSGTYEGRYEGHYGVDYQPPAYGSPQSQPAPALPPGGYISGGYYYPPPTVTTVVVEPDGTTRTTTSYGTAQVR